MFIPLTGEYLIPVILGGDKTVYAGNLIAQQFAEARDWPFGAAIAMVVIARDDGRAPGLRAAAREAGAVRWVGGCSARHAALVYAFLYAPILGRRRPRLQRRPPGRSYWEGFSTKWFGEALHDPTITEPLRNEPA